MKKKYHTGTFDLCNILKVGEISLKMLIDEQKKQYAQA